MRQAQTYSVAIKAILTCGLLATWAGCGPKPAAESSYEPALAPTTDRLVATYDDLASKRFQVLADFETPEQGTLFKLASGAQLNPLAITVERARFETGVGSLKMSLANSSQQIVTLDSYDSNWALYRDWSKYHLLLMSVFSPREFGGFTFSVRSGTDIRLTYRHGRIFLKPGWNLIRIDLARMGDEINLADVREMRFWCEPLDTPIELYLDDVILVNNEKKVFGQPESEPGELYVTAKGRRLLVGAAERFELVFARGQIIQWFDLSHDPARVHNLVGLGSLGPNPVVISGGLNPMVRLDDNTQWSGLGASVESYQSLLDVNALRAVIVSEWRFGTAGEPASEANPYHRWTYSIYPNGRIYVDCRGTAKTEMFAPSGLGIAFSCDGDAGFTRHIVEGQLGPNAASAGRAPYVLFSQGDRRQADLLIVPSQPFVVQSLRAANDPRLSALFHLPIESDRFLFSALMRVWPQDLDTLQAVNPIVADYGHPLPIRVDTGRLVRTDEGDINNDGFSEASGYYVLQLDGNVAKVRVTGQPYQRFSPTFKIVDVANRQVWVYIDGRQIKDLQRDRNGDLLFIVPGVVSDETLIEVTAGSGSASFP